ncbi:MAG: YaaR family protein [Spirochaetota bacterium]|jgi:uncharacterized protein YaaR (DUF327 family)|nr:YaaR family protein [Spirochaetota bacterium]
MVEIGRLKRDRRQDAVKSRSSGAAGKSERAISRNEDLDPLDFAHALEEADLRLLDEDLERFMGEIMRQGERLRQSPTRQAFLRYKAMVSRFLKRILELAVKTGKTRRRDREYVFADVIDERLLDLGHYLLLEEADSLAIAAAIDEIRGLLYDSLKMAKGEV